MGLMLTNKGIGPTEEKGKAVVKAREPKNALEVKRFLGLANYNVQFIPDFATVAEPFCNLSKKGVCFRFGDEQRRVFNELKSRSASAETLGHPNTNNSRSDACPVGLGTVLIQEQQGSKRVISYASKHLSDVKKWNSQTEKEALAVVWVCNCFNVYLHSTEFELYTDHKPLETIMKAMHKNLAMDPEPTTLQVQS